MITRRLQAQAFDLLEEYPVVAILGPRQVGKTTLAKVILAKNAGLYLDLELAEDRARLTDPEQYLEANVHQLVVIDEIQRQPELFQSLRGLVDRYPQRMGRFIVLGSASIQLLQQSGESLAGRIAYLELCPFDVNEVDDQQQLWLRGGFPKSFLATSMVRSKRWRRNFVRTYLERDIPQLGPRIPAETLERLWTMLAHLQGGMLNVARLAGSLGVSGKTVASYLDLFCDLLLVRKIKPWRRSLNKRLVKSPKVYIRDSGLVHHLLGLFDGDSLFGHPVMGASWEGFVIENILSVVSVDGDAYFYRTVNGAEIDLLLTIAGRNPWAIEIKSGLSPKTSKGFHYACQDIKPERKIVIYSGNDCFSVGNDTEVIGLKELLAQLTTLS